MHIALHGPGRLPAAIWFASWSPGLVSGLVLCLPLAAFTFVREARVLNRREFARGLLAGVASFQPLWHFLLFPVLPSAPSAS